jgi:hypothetical protein
MIRPAEDITLLRHGGRSQAGRGCFWIFFGSRRTIHSSMPLSPLSRLRKLCLAPPEAHEVEAWGEPTFRVKNKIFAMYAQANNHHGGGRNAMWCKATRRAAQPPAR